MKIRVRTPVGDFVSAESDEDAARIAEKTYQLAASDKIKALKLELEDGSTIVLPSGIIRDSVIEFID